jgi:benzoyl-CoA reductase/2-hydroxyglutaryl-CoA dehydratase subunit BcrC/BadD/HgdB
MAEEKKAPEKSRKSLETTREISKIIKRFYEETKSPDKKIGWASAGDPVEIFHALDIEGVYPENHTATLAAKKGTTIEYIEEAESYGYPGDLCSYARTNMGLVLKDKWLLAKPDFIIINSVCDTHQGWLQFVADYLKVPAFHLDTSYLPYNSGTLSITRLDGWEVDYMVSQLKAMISFLEGQTGKKMDYDRLSEIVRLSAQATTLWNEVHELRTAVPSPMGTADSVACLLPIFTFCGTQVAIDFYTMLRDEVAEKVSKGTGVIANEKYRLLWENVPLWHHLKLLNYVEKFGGVFAIEIYPLGFAARVTGILDPARPLESLARKYLAMFFEMSSLDTKLNATLDLCRKYKIDGVVMHNNIGCRFMHTGQVETSNALMEQLGIPSLIFHSDMADSRAYSEVQVESRLDAFMELLADKKTVYS